MKIAIVGSRGFNDYDTLKRFITETCSDNRITIEAVVSGGAKGADTLGERFADEFGYEKVVFPADWKKFGKRAGFLRNVDIIKNCDCCFAFWDGESHGTKHDIELCEQYNKPLFLKKYNE